MKADIIWLGSTDSTNEEARRHIYDIDNLSVMSASEQTSGRGQRGNTWSSAPGENLTFSIVLKFSIPGDNEEILPAVMAHDQFILTEIASISVINFLERYGIKARIKWPNDIYVGRKKICGMLIENSVRGNYLSSSIVGIGLNINQRNFDINLPNPTSMTLYRQDVDFEIRLCLKEFIEIFKGNVREFLSYENESERKRSYDTLAEIYNSELWLLNEPAYFNETSAARKFNGIIRGITPVGLLLIEDTTKGELREFAFKEISYVLDL